MTVYRGTNLKAGVTTVVDKSERIGQIIQSTIPLTDAGLHLLDGSLINGSGIYSAFVDYIASIYDPTANYFCTEAQWQTAVTTYGVCGKFVYDSVNNTVRLPKITGFTEGTIDPTVLGDIISAGLPNITGSIFNSDGSGSNDNMGTHPSTTSGSASGCFEVGANPTINMGFAAVGHSSTSTKKYSFDASRSSSIYGNSTTVQPQAIKVLYYIVIATSTKTDIQVDIDEVVTDLNGKADVDLSNINPTQNIKDTFVGWGMPDLTAGVSKSSSGFTADKNGWLSAECTAYGGASAVEVNGENIASISIVNTTAYPIGGKFFIPIHKGDVITPTYNSPYANIPVFVFYPCKGGN